MNTVLIMLGSNTQAEMNLTLAKEKLAIYFEIVAKSSRIITKPFGVQYCSDFHNEALNLLSDETFEKTKAIFKQIESDLGRKPDSKVTGIIPIDIDLIFWNETLVHHDYERFSFVRKCINEVR